MSFSSLDVFNGPIKNNYIQSANILAIINSDVRATNNVGFGNVCERD